MLSSKLVNSDPWPYHCRDCGHRQPDLEFCGHTDLFEDRRAEYTNTPNPILVALRAARIENPENDRLVQDFLEDLDGFQIGYPGCSFFDEAIEISSTEAIDHAIKVLTRLTQLT